MDQFLFFAGSIATNDLHHCSFRSTRTHYPDDGCEGGTNIIREKSICWYVLTFQRLVSFVAETADTSPLTFKNLFEVFIYDRRFCRNFGWYAKFLPMIIICYHLINLLRIFTAFCGNPADLVLIRLQSDKTLPAAQRRNYTGLVNAFVYMTIRDFLSFKYISFKTCQL